MGDQPPPTAIRTLHSHVARLRRALVQDGTDGVLLTREPGYVLVVPPDRVDAHDFEARVAAGRAALRRRDPALAMREVRVGLRLWRGEALADCERVEWANAERARLDESRLVANEILLEAELALGLHAEAAADLEYLVTRHPLRERLWGLLMVALYSAGRQAEALRAYERAGGRSWSSGWNRAATCGTSRRASFGATPTCSAGWRASTGPVGRP